MRHPYWLHDLKSRIKYHPNHLHIKTLKRGWVDCDHQLLHASMQILVNFVEKEKRDGIVDWDSDANHREAAETMERLYYWWKHDPLAQDATLMPYGTAPMEDEDDPYEGILNWLDEIYGKDDIGNWTKRVVRTCKKLNKNKAIIQQYYQCLIQLENIAVKRQNKALKDLINIRRYLWT